MIFPDIYYFLIIYIITIFISVNSFSKDKIEVELIANCGKTNGSIATADPDGFIYYCARRMAFIENNYPGAANFFILHEYGHIFLNSGNEMEVDCWTANELSQSKDPEAVKILSAATNFIKNFYKLPDPKYGGTGKQRAELINNCAINGAKFYETK